jgi:hypothetical protein
MIKFLKRVERFGKYGRKVTCIVKRYGKYGRKKVE